MPRGHYDRSKAKGAPKKGHKWKPAKSTARRKIAKERTGVFSIRSDKLISDVDSEFLTHGSTHLRERGAQAEADFAQLLHDANTLADFILCNVPYKGGVPAAVTRAYRDVKAALLNKNTK